MHLYYKSVGVVVATAEASQTHLFPGAVLVMAGRGPSI
ncbi:hypothetical protein J3D46_000926 [Paenarthrobacter sp. A20]|nr:hypothetical protein [Paenarthrobacter sp. A20]